MTDMAPLTRVPRRVKLRVEDYLRLDDAGAFEPYGKTELLDGEVVYANAQHRPHARIKSRLFRIVGDELERLNAGLEALVEGSIAMPPYNVPEPDIAVTSEADGEGLVPLESLRLVVEVADASIRNDLGRKKRIYARHGVAEYWVVDVNKGLIHQMWRPSGETYAGTREVGFGEPIAAATIDGLTIETTAL